MGLWRHELPCGSCLVLEAFRSEGLDLKDWRGVVEGNFRQRRDAGRAHFSSSTCGSLAVASGAWRGEEKVRPARGRSWVPFQVTMSSDFILLAMGAVKGFWAGKQPEVCRRNYCLRDMGVESIWNHRAASKPEYSKKLIPSTQIDLTKICQLRDGNTEAKDKNLSALESRFWWCWEGDR